MKINTDTHYLFRMTNMEMKINTIHTTSVMTNMEDEDKHRYTLLIQDDKHASKMKMNINTDTPYLFRMTNMEVEHKQMRHKHRYTLLIQDDKRER